MGNPAKYRNVVTFEEFKETQDDSGNWIESWETSDLGTTYAQIRNIRGREFIQAEAAKVEVTARINMRYRIDVEDKYFEKREKLRIKYNNRIFNIVYMNNLEERNQELEFLVNEVR